MHPAAKDWDLKHGHSVKHHTVKKGQYVPKGRPCDWCGRPVKLGFIHDGCWDQQKQMYIDLDLL